MHSSGRNSKSTTTMASTGSSKKKDERDDNDSNKVLYSGWDFVDIPKPEQTFYAITGTESQVLTVRLNGGETIRGEPGSMLYLTDGMKQTVSCDQCWNRYVEIAGLTSPIPGLSLISASSLLLLPFMHYVLWIRCCTGEDCCTVNFVNDASSSPAYASLTPSFPTAKVVPIDLSSPNVGGTSTSKTNYISDCILLDYFSHVKLLLLTHRRNPHVHLLFYKAPSFARADH